MTTRRHRISYQTHRGTTTIREVDAPLLAKTMRNLWQARITAEACSTIDPSNRTGAVETNNDGTLVWWSE